MTHGAAMGHAVKHPLKELTWILQKLTMSLWVVEP